MAAVGRLRGHRAAALAHACHRPAAGPRVPRDRTLGVKNCSPRRSRRRLPGLCAARAPVAAGISVRDVDTGDVITPRPPPPGPGPATFSWRQTLFSERGTLIAIAAGIAPPAAETSNVERITWRNSTFYVRRSTFFVFASAASCSVCHRIHDATDRYGCQRFAGLQHALRVGPLPQPGTAAESRSRCRGRPPGRTSGRCSRNIRNISAVQRPNPFTAVPDARSPGRPATRRAPSRRSRSSPIRVHKSRR